MGESAYCIGLVDGGREGTIVVLLDCCWILVLFPLVPPLPP